ncbi:hypothetical protein KSS87_021145 [Heliosperma pusillum]|nr:hypothetical protein KSS87_021145 [Heliosperma pusillum]
MPSLDDSAVRNLLGLSEDQRKFPRLLTLKFGGVVEEPSEGAEEDSASLEEIGEFESAAEVKMSSGEFLDCLCIRMDVCYVFYDHRSLIIGGQRRMLISAGIHYPRSTPDMWPHLIAKAKEGGADVVETYTFWNAHEPLKAQYNFQGRYDLVKFVNLVGSTGLFLFLRIGPYVCAEWNFGGFPVWLRDIPGIEFRTDNAPFKEEMQQYVTKIVNLMLEERLFSWQGGPIILLQIENEYGDFEKSYGKKGQNYIQWAAKMAVELGAGVPWVMCKQTDAPEFIIDTCNGYYCDGFKPNSKKKPIFWTENWDGWYTTWGGRLPHRPAEDLAFAVARFFQRGGSLQNYYMYFGGTNFGRTSGGPFYITSYDYDAPIDEYGLLSQPKWGHLKDLHAAIKLCEAALVAVDSPQYVKLGPQQEAHVYQQRGIGGNNSRCSAFLANINEHNVASVKFRGHVYSLPPWSVSILPDCKNVAYNTAKVAAQTSIKEIQSNLHHPSNVSQHVLLRSNGPSLISRNWMRVDESVGVWINGSFTVHGILEHLNVTKDSSDYLWHFTRIYISADDISFWKRSGVSPALTIDSMRDVVHIFVNGQLAGSGVGRWVQVFQPVQLLEGYNDIVLLSLTVGLQNYGAFLEKDGGGFRGQIKLIGLSNGDMNLSGSSWIYQVGLKGENLEIYTLEGTKKASWLDLTVDAVEHPLSWYKLLLPEKLSSLHHYSMAKVAICFHHQLSWTKTFCFSFSFLSSDIIQGGSHHSFLAAPSFSSCKPIAKSELEEYYSPASVPIRISTCYYIWIIEKVELQSVCGGKEGSLERGEGELGSMNTPPSSIPVSDKDTRGKMSWIPIGVRPVRFFLIIWTRPEHSDSVHATYFDAPDGIEPVALDLKSMGKGQAWVNGHHIGRYWTLSAPEDGCQSTCDYRGKYDSDKCTTNCGKPTQVRERSDLVSADVDYLVQIDMESLSVDLRYHVPRSWLKESNNLLVIFEEIRGNPFEISITSHTTHTICAEVSESHYPPLSKWLTSDSIDGKIFIDDTTPEMYLNCEPGYAISTTFASYGIPHGSCQRYSTGSCHSSNSFNVVSELCEGKQECTIGVSNAIFGGDPCRGVVKTLAVEAKCLSSKVTKSSFVDVL